MKDFGGICALASFAGFIVLIGLGFAAIWTVPNSPWWMEKVAMTAAFVMVLGYAGSKLAFEMMEDAKK